MMNSINLIDESRPAYMGITAFVGEKPYLIIGKEDNNYVMEGEDGDVIRISYTFPWTPAVDQAPLVAASRKEGSVLAYGSTIKGFTIGKLAYVDGSWFVRVDDTDIAFPLEEAVEALVQAKWDKTAIVNEQFTNALTKVADAISEDTAQEESHGYTIQGIPAGGGKAEAMAIRVDQLSKDEIEAILAKLEGHEVDAERQRQYFKEHHDWGHYDNPYINRGGSVKEGVQFAPGPGGQGYTAAHGFILVSSWFTTDDTWILVHPRCEGVVAKTGGMSNHGIVVARGRNLACVGDIGNKIDLIKTGDNLRIDGDTGIVEGNGGDPTFQMGEVKKARHVIDRFIWWNGFHDIRKVNPEDPNQPDTLHETMIDEMRKAGEFQFDEHSSGGVVYDTGECEIFNKVPEEEQFEQWLHQQFPNITSIEVTNAYGMGATASVKEAAGTVTVPFPPYGIHNLTIEAFNQHRLTASVKFDDGSVFEIPSPMLFMRLMKWKMQDYPAAKGGASPVGTPVEVTSDNPELAAKLIEECGNSAPGGDKTSAEFTTDRDIDSWEELKNHVCPECEQGTVEINGDEARCPNCGWEGTPFDLIPATGNSEGYQSTEVYSGWMPPLEILSEFQKGAPYPKNDDEVDHSAPGHHLPKKVNEIYNAIKRENPEYSKEKAIRIAWERSGLKHEKKSENEDEASQTSIFDVDPDVVEYIKQLAEATDMSAHEIAAEIMDSYENPNNEDWAEIEDLVEETRKSNPHEAAIEDLPKPIQCPECESHSYKPLKTDKVHQKVDCLCLNCGNRFDHDALVTSAKNSKHDPGTRVVLEHPKFKGQRGTVLDSKGKHKDLDEDKYKILLDNGETIDDILESHFKRIKSAAVETTSSFLDVNGAPMEADKWYTMYSTQYTVPDVIQIVSLDDGRIRAHIEGDTKGLFPITVESSEIEQNGYSFEPYLPPKTSSSKEAKNSLTNNQQKELINENPNGRARNFHKINLEGTHYIVEEDDDADDPLSRAFLF